MNQKKLLDKIVKKDYNNELEKILESKKIDETAKSTLLSILYKIEVSYKDMQIVKRGIETKEEYIEELLEIIKNKCNSIKIVKMSDRENVIPENKTYIISKKNKEIIAYPIERKILYAIYKLGKKEKIIKDDYFVINETLSDLINVGNSIEKIEPLRDFNGYSWTNIPNEIESINHNLIYQNLRILLGYEFLNKWVSNNEFIIDFFEKFNEELEEKYGKKNKDEFLENLIRLSILLGVKHNSEQKEKMLKMKKEIEKLLNQMQDKRQFVEEATNNKSEILEKIKKIDKIISNKNLLQDEYKIRNSKLPLEKKIFSMKVLSKVMQEEKKEYLKKIEELNKMISPKKFIEYREGLEKKYKYLEILNTENYENKIEEIILELQKSFLHMVKLNIKKAKDKQDIQNEIYNLRYYLLLPYNSYESIYKIKELEKDIKEVTKILIDKAIKFKVLETISENEDINYDILKNIFKVRIIKLEDSYLKLTKEKDKYFVQIFDENIFEEKIEIPKLDELQIKLNKKVSVFI